MLQMLSIDVANTCCCVLQMLNFNVADVKFRCCRPVMLGLCRGGGGTGLLMLDVARNTVRNMVATWGRGKKDS
jgi:hypothetical protein